MTRHLLLFFLACVSGLSMAQSAFVVSGYVRDADSGETIIGANITLAEDGRVGTATNTYGFYSLSLPPGKHTLIYSFLGYTSQRFPVDLDKAVTINVNLKAGVEMEAIVVEAKANEDDENVQSTSMGRVTLPIEQIKALPALLGEVDVLKTIQLLPGVSSAGEGSAGFYVRGGGADQNLVLLDEAVVYNSGHFLGFFSVFNADAINSTTLIKGGIPAVYGGRLSSVLDIQMKEGNNQQFAAEGGIGLISSRLTVEGPLARDKSSFLLSGRRTYGFDLAQPFIRKTDFAGTNYYFYDLNAKVNYRFSQRDRLFVSGYFGRDVLTLAQPGRDFKFRIPYGNSTTTVRWNHLFNDKLFFNLSAIYNDYQFAATFAQDDFQFNLNSSVRDYGGKFDFEYFPSVHHQVKAGLHVTRHKLTPSIVSGFAGDVEFEPSNSPKYANEYALYLQDDWQLSPWLRINGGLRGTLFQQTGPYTSKATGKEYGPGDVVKQYGSLEPRLFVNTALSPQSAIKGGVTFTTQYIHLVSNSSSTLPTDTWVPSSENVKPQRGIQYAVGYFRNFKQNAYEASAEIYYKSLRDQIDYRESFVDNSSNDIESEFVFGKGEAYGLELFVRKNRGALTGWIGYTLSRTTRTFPDIEGGRRFPSIYDRTHDLSVVTNYRISPKFLLGAVFVYATGRAYTPLERIYVIEGNLQPDYGPRNSQRLEPYHRLDLSLVYTPKPFSTKRFRSEWVLSVYNAYSRLNTFYIYNDLDTDFETGSVTTQAYKVALFPVIPTITWNFKWK